MKMSPEYIHAQANMAPGEITAEGFLGTDQRLLADIIEADEEAMGSVNINFQQLGRRMQYLLNEGRKGLGDERTVDQWLVQVSEARGFLPCPFEDGIFRKLTATVTRQGVSLIYSDLSIHLAEKHHFLQGKGSPFRLEPQTIKDILFP